MNLAFVFCRNVNCPVNISHLYSAWLETTSSNVSNNSSPVVNSSCLQIELNQSSTYNNATIPCSPVNTGHLFFFLFCHPMFGSTVLSPILSVQILNRTKYTDLGSFLRPFVSLNCLSLIEWWWSIKPFECNYSARDRV